MAVLDWEFKKKKCPVSVCKWCQTSLSASTGSPCRWKVKAVSVKDVLRLVSVLIGPLARGQGRERAGVWWYYVPQNRLFSHHRARAHSCVEANTDSEWIHSWSFSRCRKQCTSQNRQCSRTDYLDMVLFALFYLLLTLILPSGVCWLRPRDYKVLQKVLKTGIMETNNYGSLSESL